MLLLYAVIYCNQCYMKITKFDSCLNYRYLPFHWIPWHKKKAKWFGSDCMVDSWKCCLWLNHKSKCEIIIIKKKAITTEINKRTSLFVMRRKKICNIFVVFSFFVACCLLNFFVFAFFYLFHFYSSFTIRMHLVLFLFLF